MVYLPTPTFGGFLWISGRWILWNIKQHTFNLKKGAVVFFPEWPTYFQWPRIAPGLKKQSLQYDQLWVPRKNYGHGSVPGIISLPMTDPWYERYICRSINLYIYIYK